MIAAGVAAILLLFYCGLLLMVVSCLLSWWVWFVVWNLWLVVICFGIGFVSLVLGVICGVL